MDLPRLSNVRVCTEAVRAISAVGGVTMSSLQRTGAVWFATRRYRLEFDPQGTSAAAKVVRYDGKSTVVLSRLTEERDGNAVRYGGGLDHVLQIPVRDRTGGR